MAYKALQTTKTSLPLWISKAYMWWGWSRHITTYAQRAKASLAPASYKGQQPWDSPPATYHTTRAVEATLVSKTIQYMSTSKMIGDPEKIEPYEILRRMILASARHAISSIYLPPTASTSHPQQLRPLDTSIDLTRSRSRIQRCHGDFC